MTIKLSTFCLIPSSSCVGKKETGDIGAACPVPLEPEHQIVQASLAAPGRRASFAMPCSLSSFAASTISFYRSSSALSEDSD